MPTAKAAPKIERAFRDTSAIVPLYCSDPAWAVWAEGARLISACGGARLV